MKQSSHASPFLSVSATSSSPPLGVSGKNNAMMDHDNPHSYHNHNHSNDTAVFCSDLQACAHILSDRGLLLSSKWCTELWMGLPAAVIEASQGTASAFLPSPDDVGSNDNTMNNTNSSTHSAATMSTKTPLVSPFAAAFDTVSDRRDPAVAYSATLTALGDYAHAAAVLSETSLTNRAACVETMPPPLAGLTAGAIFRRAYALYLAGERKKEEDSLELQSQGQKHAVGTNPYLSQLAQELLDAYEDNRLDAFGLHVYGMVLSKCSIVPPQSPAAHTVLIQSILDFPYNWSAWLDLAALCENPHAETAIEETLQPKLCAHPMYHFFCAHLHAERQTHDQALTIYERWMDPQLFGGSPYLLSQYAVCSYHAREMAQAKSLLEDLHRHTPYRLDCMDVFSNILYVQQDSVALSALAHVAISVDKYRPETCCIVGNYYSLKQHRAAAIRYFSRALRLDPTFSSAWTLLGHEYVEWKQTAHAMDAYRQAVATRPTDYRPWYGLGQTYELLGLFLYALYYYQRAAVLRPADARVWCAVGSVCAALHRTQEAVRAYERAVELDDPEGVATQKLAGLHRAAGREDPAAACYMRHLEWRWSNMLENSHAAQHGHHGGGGVASTSGGGDDDAAAVATTNTNPFTVIGATRRDSLEECLHSIAVDSVEAEAILFLATYHRNHEDYELAGVFCARLLDYPGPEKEPAKAMLREVRSIESRRTAGRASSIHTRSQGPVSNKPFQFSP